jgi:hypothetical protein
MAAAVVLLSRFPLASPVEQQALFSLLQDQPGLRYLLSLDGQELLQLRGYDTLSQFAAGSEALLADLHRFTPFIRGDVRRELLTFIEAPKPSSGALPDNDFLQLRHIEVPPQRMAEYRRWRETTIFEVVRRSPAIETFLAYHSLVSGQPGVMFLSGFSCDRHDYLSVFSTEHYKEIVRQAGDSYIAGGADGLYTTLYARPTMIGSMP